MDGQGTRPSPSPCKEQMSWILFPADLASLKLHCTCFFNVSSMNNKSKTPSSSACRDFWRTTRAYPNPDLASLGRSIVTLPPSLWRPNMFLKGAEDNALRSVTEDFPRLVKHKGTHPVFVIKIVADSRIRLCPCTSRAAKTRYIPQGTRLKTTGIVMDRDSYILEAYSFHLPLDPEFSRGLRYQGIVSPSSIRRRT